jgi:uncharacterized protein (UPF0264 family)
MRHVGEIDPGKPRSHTPSVPITVPRLLVSVRHVAEVSSALLGGTDIFDVKNPAVGSLGRALPNVIKDIAAALERSLPQTPLSVALGELTEWDAAAAASLPANVCWVKLGLAGCADLPNWLSRWQQCRRQMDTTAGRPLGWIAVAYADHRAANSPTPQDVLAAAIETRCTGVLIDTFTKQGRRLGDWIAPPELAEWLTTARQHGLTTAVAGSLHRDDLSWLSPLQPDIVAIRSAACVGGQRAAAIDAEAIVSFRHALHSVVNVNATSPA